MQPLVLWAERSGFVDSVFFSTLVSIIVLMVKLDVYAYNFIFYVMISGVGTSYWVSASAGANYKALF